MPAGMEMLATSRLNTIMQELRDIRELPQELLFLNRTSIVDALDGEITAYVRENATIADIVPDDAPARTYGGEQVRTEINALPNIKHGRKLTQEFLSLLQRLEANTAGADEIGFFSNFRMRQIDRLLLGVRQTMELLRVGTAIDEVTWDRTGQNFTASFGKPSDLKVTVGGGAGQITAWTDTENATPIDDIMVLRQNAREKYGVDYNRITLGSSDLRLIFNTDEFRNKATLYSQLVLPSADSFPVSDMAMMSSILGRILGMEIETYDAHYWTQNNDGSEVSARYLPEGKVILSNSAWDNDGSVVDFANGVVTESVVGSMSSGAIVGGFTSPLRGPIAYATATPDLNPPNVTMWAVARGFPRLHRKEAEAVLTVRA